MPLLTLLLAGLLVLGVHRPPALPLLLVPTAVVAAAGLAGAYPIAGRLALFFVPLVALAVAAALEAPRLVAGAAAAGTVVLVGPQLVGDWRGLSTRRRSRSPAPCWPRSPPARPARPAAGGRARRPVRGRLLRAAGRGRPVPGAPAGPAEPGCLRTTLGARLWAERRYDRVWLLASHTRPVELALYQAQLAQFGAVAEVIEATGATAVRFDRSPAPLPPPRAADRRPGAAWTCSTRRPCPDRAALALALAPPRAAPAPPPARPGPARPGPRVTHPPRE